MTLRALSFGPVAAAYDRYRLGYPDSVADAVLDFAARPVRSALEIGAGTGKATRCFVERGIALTATDPDPQMLAELRRQLPDTVMVHQGALEDLSCESPYDLVFAAACLHWTDPAHRWDRISALLVGGGTFASFGGQLLVADPALDAAIRKARAPWLADDAIASPDGTPDDAAMSWPGSELVTDARFSDVQQSTIERRFALRADDFVGHLATVSAYLALSVEDRRTVLGRILDLLPEQVALTADITLHLARTADSTSEAPRPG